MSNSHSQQTGADLHGTKQTIVSVKPTSTPDYVGQELKQISSDRTVNWVAWNNGSALVWRATGGTPVDYNGNPNNNITPDYVGQEAIDLGNDTRYWASGTASSDWIQYGTSTGGT